MSNIERKYAYYDEGVLPEEGEYGVTYLTLYSSSAGNIYDGWIYDPDNKIPVSVTERTFGYRHPEFSQYCWDDEVVVDLSNAQSRQESSEFTQGRITSFNTNVSPYPIVLQDVDISEMTESEREEHATTVLFTAIPLVSDAYIQAQIEVQCKCNLSPDNTSGEMRIEAFYILNDESDRTMRPNPVHTFAVSSQDERKTLPWIYFNPALKHDTNNYIGVKLICTGGTAEIGISDVKEYGEAMITLASAGLTGDKIYDGKPSRIWIEGEQLVPIGYKLAIEDYDVFCEYDDGSIYLVTHFCKFTPEIGTEVTENFLLQAEYVGLHATLRIIVVPVERIELTGTDIFYSTLTLDISEYNVLGYLTNGDIWDVTDQCEYSPIMGTTINQTTSLTATFINPGQTPVPVSDTLLIEKEDPIIVSRNVNNGLIYSLYGDKTVEITGTANLPNSMHEVVEIPSDIETYLRSHSLGPYVLKWNAEGSIGGIHLPVRDDDALYDKLYRFDGFDDISFSTMSTSDNWVVVDLAGQRIVTSTNLKFLSNIGNKKVRVDAHMPNNMRMMFYKCEELTNLDFLSEWNTSGATDMGQMFYKCTNLIDLKGLSDWDTSSVEDMSEMFRDCINLESLNGLQNFSLISLVDASIMFFNDSKIKYADPLWFWAPSSLENLLGMFWNCESLESIAFFTNWPKETWTNILDLVRNCHSLENVKGLEDIKWENFTNSNNGNPFTGCGIINLEGSEDWKFEDDARLPFRFEDCLRLEDISAVENWDVSKVTGATDLFTNCALLEDISPLANWNVSRFTTMTAMFGRTKVSDLEPLRHWDVSNVEIFTGMFGGCDELSSLNPLADWDVSSATSVANMFSNDDKVRYIGCLSGWVFGSNSVICTGMFKRSSADKDNNYVNTHIIDADGLNWSVIPYIGLGNDTPFAGTDVPLDNNYMRNKLYSLPSWYITARGYQP